MKAKLLATVLAGALSWSAQASQVDLPVSTVPSGPPEADLQWILNNVVFTSGGSVPDVTTGQQHNSQWGGTSSTVSSQPTLYWEAAANANSNLFGIWFGSPGNYLYVPLFFGQADDGPGPGGGGTILTAGGLTSTASITITNGTMSIGSSEPFIACGSILNLLGSVNCGTINNPLINTDSFGFFFGTNANQQWDPNPLPLTAYSFTNPATAGYSEFASSLDTQSTLSAGEIPRFVAYQQGTTTNWAFAYEDGQGTARDNDYNDMVVKVESIRAVPLPGTLALLGVGLLAGGLLRRRQA